MRKVIIALFLIVSVSTVSAQSANINQGNWMVGGNAGINSVTFGEDDDDQTTVLNFSPNVGYFFINNLAGGLRFSFVSAKEKNDDDADIELSASPFIRYYFLPSSQNVNIFADASYGIGSMGQGDKESFNQFAISAGPAIFLTPSVALELAVGYNSRGGDAYGNDERLKTIGFNVGFQIHLGGAKQ